MPEATEPQKSTSLPRGEKIYNAERGKVQLAYKEFLPSKNSEGLTPEQAIVYIPGFPNDAGDASIGTIPQAFAENGNMRTFALSATRSIRANTSDETDAMLEFIREQGLKDVTLSGYSMGAARAVDLAAKIKALRGTPDEIKVNGLILFDPAGVHNEGGITKRFLSDFPQDVQENKKYNRSGIQSIKDLVGAIKNKVKFTKGAYPITLAQDIRNLSKMTPSTQEIDVPVVLVTPGRDPVSKNLAPLENPKTAREVLTTAAQRNAMTEDERKERYKNVQDARAGRAQNTKDREAYVAEEIFPNSKSVSVLRPEEKHATHAGMQNFRYDQATKTGLYMLNRLKRLQKPNNK